MGVASRGSQNVSQPAHGASSISANNTGKRGYLSHVLSGGTLPVAASRKCTYTLSQLDKYNIHSKYTQMLL